MSSTPLTLRCLDEADRPQMFALLATDHLRPEGILAQNTRYWGVLDGPALVGMMGVELENESALLRSAIVATAYRRQGVATRLTQTVLAEVRALGLRTLYLFGTTAGPFWEKQGFQAIPVAEITRHLPHAPQVRLFDALGWLPDELAFKLEL